MHTLQKLTPKKPRNGGPRHFDSPTGFPGAVRFRPIVIVVLSAESQVARVDRGKRCRVGGPWNSRGKGRVYRAALGVLHEFIPKVRPAQSAHDKSRFHFVRLPTCSQNSTRQHFRLDQKHILRASHVAVAGEPGHVAKHGDNQPHTGRCFDGPQQLRIAPCTRNAVLVIDTNARIIIARNNNIKY